MGAELNSIGRAQILPARQIPGQTHEKTSTDIATRFQGDATRKRSQVTAQNALSAKGEEICMLSKREQIIGFRTNAATHQKLFSCYSFKAHSAMVQMLCPGRYYSYRPR